jgi:hypothetical protein
MSTKDVRLAHRYVTIRFLGEREDCGRNVVFGVADPEKHKDEIDKLERK